MFAFPYSRLGCVMSGGAGWCKLQLTRHKSPPADQRVVQLWWSSSCKAVAAPSWDRATSRGRHFLRRHSRPPPLVASSFSPHAFLFWQENRVEGQNLLLPGKTVDDKIGSRTGSSICALHGTASCGLPWDYQQITRAQISWLRQNRFCQKTKSVFLTALIEVEKGPVPISQRKFPTNSLLTAFNCCRYQNDLPKKIKGRGKEGHVTHEELVQTIKWKLAVSSVNHICVPRNCIIS